MTPTTANCDFPPGETFGFRDDPGEHDPCYVIMPGGAMLVFNHHAGEGVDLARARFVQAACNAALKDEGWRPIESAPKDGTPVLLALADGDFPLVGSSEGGDFGCMQHGDVFYPQPTMWYALPTAPTQSAGGTET